MTRMPDDPFDARMRTLLRELPLPEQPLTLSAPPLPRRAFLRQGLGWTAGLAILSLGGLLGRDYLHTPPLVLAAIRHVDEETGLRGMLVPDPAPVRAALGLPAAAPWPGILQLCKSCRVDGHRAWHLSLFQERLGYVQVLIFQHILPHAADQGRWLRHHWRFTAAPSGRSMLLLSRHPLALARVQAALKL